MVNSAVYGIMCKHIVESDRPQMTIWRMRIAWCIAKATNTHPYHTIGQLLLFHCNNCCTNAPQCYIYVHCLSCCNLTFLIQQQSCSLRSKDYNLHLRQSYLYSILLVPLKYSEIPHFSQDEWRSWKQAVRKECPDLPRHVVAELVKLGGLGF